MLTKTAQVILYVYLGGFVKAKKQVNVSTKTSLKDIGHTVSGVRMMQTEDGCVVLFPNFYRSEAVIQEKPADVIEIFTKKKVA